jgi:transcription-repair coupling factor (superfamily II helicase)
VQEIKGEEPPPKIDPEIHLRIEALIPEEYVPDSQQRMNLYKRLSRADSASEIDDIEEEIIDLYGKTPVQVSRLLAVMRIRLDLRNLRILRLDYTGKELIFAFDAETKVNPLVLVWWAQKDRRVRVLPGDKLGYVIGQADEEARVRYASAVLDRLRESGKPQDVFSDSDRAASDTTEKTSINAE